ncbi:MAG TPA: hypothetical protein VIS51_01055 [Solirubrobacterales bacterium]
MTTALPRHRIVLALISLTLAIASLGATASAEASHGPPGELLAYKVLNARHGGVVRAPRGTKIFIPPRALVRNGLVTIVKMRGGRYDFHIGVPWSGRVAVTMPPHRRASVVLHKVGGIWVREGKRDQRTVWVSQLSIFSWASDRLKAAACISKNPRQIIECLASKGLSWVDSHLVKWIAELAGVSDECARSLLASKGVVGVLYNVIISSACTGHAGETYHVPPNPPPPSSPSAPPAAPPPPSPTYYVEQQGSLGANTFMNPFNASGMGATIPPYAVVQVTCKVYAPQILSANPDGYWYRIHSSPWNDAYYAVANTFWNGDIPGQKPYTHNTDFSVRDC